MAAYLAAIFILLSMRLVKRRYLTLYILLHFPLCYYTV